MAEEIRTSQARLAGAAVYALVIDPTGTAVWNGAAYEALDPAHWAAYAVPLAESPPGSGSFTGSVPAAVPAGSLNVVAYRRATGSPLPADPPVAEGVVAWTPPPRFRPWFVGAPPAPGTGVC